MINVIPLIVISGLSALVSFSIGITGIIKYQAKKETDQRLFDVHKNELDTKEVVLKTAEAQLVAASLGIIANDLDGESPVLQTLLNNIIEHLTALGVTNIGNVMFIYHDLEQRNHYSIPIEIAIPIFEKIPESESVWVYELPKVEKIASLVHSVSKDNRLEIEKADETLFQWIKKNNYQIINSRREIFLEFDKTRYPSVIEIQYPIKKASSNKKTFFSWLLSFFNNN